MEEISDLTDLHISDTREWPAGLNDPSDSAMEDDRMRIVCDHEEFHPDTRCSVCGEGFVLYFEGESSHDKSMAIQETMMVLSHHHDEHEGNNVHPRGIFILEERKGKIPAAILPRTDLMPSWGTRCSEC
jgi:hypothetical protein